MTQRRPSPSLRPATAATASSAGRTTAPDCWSHAIGGLLVLAMFLACCIPLSDTDLFWHLKTGEWILEHRQVPYVDLYTFTNADRPWIDLHWGFQVLIATVYRIGGSALLVTVKALVLAAVVGIGWWSAGHDLPAWLRGVPWMLALVTISGRGYERPEIFSLLFLAIWLWLMERLDNRPVWLWWLPVLQMLWINMHALFVLGLVVGGCRALDELLRRVAEGRLGLMPAAKTITLRQAGYVAALCALATLSNPYFEEGALFPLVLYRKFNVEQAFYSQHIGEFAQPIAMYRLLGFRNVYFDAELLLWCLAALSFVLPAVALRRWSPYRLLLFAAFSHLAWEAVRNTNIFSLVAAVVTAGNMNDWWQDRCGGAQRTSWVSRGNWAAAAALSLFGVLTVTGHWHRAAGEDKSFGFGERLAWYPHAAARFAGQVGFPHHAFASHFGVASVYTWHNGPDRKVFMDGRLEVCSQRTFEHYNAILAQMAAGQSGWERGLRDHEGRLPVVLLDSRQNLSRAAIMGLYAQPQWRLVFADASCAVFLETALAERLGLPAVDYTPLIEPPGVNVRGKSVRNARKPPGH